MRVMHLTKPPKLYNFEELKKICAVIKNKRNLWIIKNNRAP